MIPLALAMLTILTHAAAPLPDGKTIDSLSFSFKGGLFEPTGGLTITADGSLSYQFVPASFGAGMLIQTTWEVPKAEVASLFRNLVEHGLLDLSDRLPLDPNRFLITSGRWSMTVSANAVPAKILADLRPYLAKAHPDKWKEKPCDNKPVATEVKYIFTEKLDGTQIMLTVARDGEVRYTRDDNSVQAAKPMPVNESWLLKPDEAEKLLDTLIADGLLAHDNTGKGKLPCHYVQVSAGKWKTEFFSKEMPDAIKKHFHPLLEKADPEVWKKP